MYSRNTLFKIFLFGFALTISNEIFAQNAAATNWFFGRGSGLKFTNGVASFFNTDPFVSFENTTSISAPNGNLLFASNGSVVWNRNLQVMSNGTGLQGSDMNTQGVAIVPIPGINFKFLLFVVNPTTGLSYSEVDMSLNNGLGNISATTKNVSLYNGPLTEKVAVGRHCNGTDYWLVVHTPGSNQFLSYLVNNGGVSTTPVASNTGIVHTVNKGYMKFSPDSKRIAIALTRPTPGNNVEVYDFNRSTGQVTNPIPLSGTGGEYGLSFSPNSGFLYVSSATDVPSGGKINQLVQFRINSSNIESTKAVIAVRNFPLASGYGALQLGNDKKIYLTQQFIDRLHVIENPNEPASSLIFKDSAVFMPNATGRLGLPNMIEEWFKDTLQAKFRSELSCKSAPYLFFDSTFSNASSWSWDFGDPNTTSDVSTAKNPSYTYPDTGTYVISLVVDNGCGETSTFVDTLLVKENLPIDLRLPLDTGVCIGQTLNIATDIIASATYAWQLGSSSTPIAWTNIGNATPNISLSTSGWYRLFVATANGCLGWDSVNFTVVGNPPSVNLGNNTQYICGRTPLTLNSNQPNLLKYWSTGDTTTTIEVTTPGRVVLTVDEKGCRVKDSVDIVVENLPLLDLGADKGWCDGQTFNLDVASAGTSYQWNTGSTLSRIIVSDTGTYSVETTGPLGCKQRDTLVAFLECPFRIAIPSAFTPDDDNLNDVFLPLIDPTDLYKLEIFDRLGQILFTTNDPLKGWDGKVDGKVMQEGFYVYLVTYKEAGKLRTKRAKGMIWLTY